MHQVLLMSGTSSGGEARVMHHKQQRIERTADLVELHEGL